MVISSSEEKAGYLIHGGQIQQTVRAAALLGVLDFFQGPPKSLEEFLEYLKEDLERIPTPDILYRFLSLLVSLEILEMSEREYFCLTDLGKILRSRKGLIIHTGHPQIMRPWSELVEALTTGEPVFPRIFGQTPWEYRRDNPDAQQAFVNGMRANAVRDMQAIRNKLPSLTLSGNETVVDIGGGVGDLLVLFLEGYPDMKGILLEQNETTDRAKENLSRKDERISSRIQVIAGDFLESVPRGDILCLKFVLNDWPSEKAVEILKNCRKAAHLGTRLLIMEPVLESDQGYAQANVNPHILDMQMHLMHGGRVRTQKEFEHLVESSGWNFQQSISTTGSQSILVCTP